MINTVEQHLIALVKDTLPNKLKKVDALPGNLNEELIKVISAASPAVYIAYLGGRKGNSKQQDAIWALYTVTSAGDQAKRRAGDARVLGAYDMLDILLPAFHEHVIPDIGTVTFERVQNLFSVSLNKKGVTVYAATFRVPLSLEYTADETALNEFITYHAEHSMAPGDDEPAAVDIVTLPQV